MSEYSMYDPMQSAYKLVHSTETVHMKMKYYILTSFDTGKCTVLVSLEFSSAFDIINHNELLNRIPYLYGINGTAFIWFQSYIEQSKQPMLCWRLPFTKTTSNVKCTTRFRVGCDTVHHIHLPCSINFQQTQCGVL